MIDNIVIAFLKRMVWAWENPGPAFAADYATLLCLFVLLIVVMHIWGRVKEIWR